MLVILKKEVPNLGQAGALVEVKNGYGRNYLIPQGLAIPASEGNKRALEHQLKMAEALRRKELAAAQELAAKLSDTAITIKRDAGEDDKLFGSVTNRDIAESLAAEGIELDRRLIVLDEPIKAIGLFNVAVRVHRDVEASVRVFVMKNS